MDPHQLSEKGLALAAEYRRATEELAGLKKAHGVRWLEIRKNTKTDKEADMHMSATPVGQREIELMYLLKGIEKEIGAVKSHLRVMDVFGN